MILHDLFEGKMKELDIEYQDFLNSRGRRAMTDKMFQQAYGMTRTEWAKQNKEWIWQKERRPSAPDAHLFHEEVNGEYNDEAGMAQTNLHTTARAVQGLLDTIDDRENLPEWVQEKIAKAEAMLVSAWDYLLSKEEQGIDPKIAEGAMKNLHAEFADKYRELAPKIEKYKDSYLAGQLYDALEAIAVEHNAELEFKRMLAGARNRAHMDYDTNPGGFQNWFWYLPFADDGDVEEGSQTFNKPEPYWVCVDGKKWKRFETYQQARNVHDRLEKKLRSEGSAKRVSLLAAEQLDEKQDACYHKVKSRYKVWPSAYASGALVQCRKKGAANWGNKSKK